MRAEIVALFAILPNLCFHHRIHLKVNYVVVCWFVLSQWLLWLLAKHKVSRFSSKTQSLISIVSRLVPYDSRLHYARCVLNFLYTPTHRQGHPQGAVRLLPEQITEAFSIGDRSECYRRPGAGQSSQLNIQRYAFYSRKSEIPTFVYHPYSL